MSSFAKFNIIFSLSLAFSSTSALATKSVSSIAERSVSSGMPADLRSPEETEVTDLQSVANNCVLSVRQDMRSHPRSWPTDTMELKISVGKFLAACVHEHWDETIHKVSIEFVLDEETGTLKEYIYRK